MRLWAPHPRFSLHVFYFFFFFFLPAFVDFGRQILVLWTVYTLFTHYAYIVHVLKNIKMGLTILFTHLKIILLQCFQFLVFSNNKFNTNTPIEIDGCVFTFESDHAPAPLGFVFTNCHRGPALLPYCFPWETKTITPHHHHRHITNNLSGVPTPADDPVKPKTFEHRIDIGLGGPAAAAAGGDEKSDLLGYVVFSGKLVWDKRKTSNNNATDVQQTSNTDVTGQVAVDTKLTSRALVWGSHILPLDDVISVSSFFHAHYILPTRKTKKSFFSHFAIVVQDSLTLWQVPHNNGLIHFTVHSYPLKKVHVASLVSSNLEEVARIFVSWLLP